MAVENKIPSVNRSFAVAQALATRLLRTKVGDKFEKLSELQREFSVGAGTIQAAIKNIEMMDGVKIRRSGHQGSYIEALNPKQLWSLSGRPPLIGVFPSFAAQEMREARVLFREKMSRFGIPFFTSEQPGAMGRLESVITQQADFAILSNGVTENIPEETKNNLCFFRFDAGTYYSPVSIVILYREGSDPYSSAETCRTGFDPSSNDHFSLSMAEFGDLSPPTAIECDYLDIPKLIFTGEIDRAVWRKIDTLIPLELIKIQSAPLRSPEANKLFLKYSQMVLVTRKEDSFIGAMALGEGG